MSFKRKKILHSMLLLLVSLIVCLNSIGICEHNEIADHEDGAYRHLTVINSECENNQPCDDCVQQADDSNIKFAVDNILSRLSKRLSLAFNDTSYFSYCYSVNDFRRGWRPTALRLLLQDHLLKSVILRL